jgi:hypothetical protein
VSRGLLTREEKDLAGEIPGRNAASGLHWSLMLLAYRLFTLRAQKVLFDVTSK